MSYNTTDANDLRAELIMEHKRYDELMEEYKAMEKSRDEILEKFMNLCEFIKQKLGK